MEFWHLLFPLPALGLPKWSAVKNPPANARDAGSIPQSGKSPGGGNGNPLQYSCLGNPMDRGAWWATIHGVTKESDMTERLNTNSQLCPGLGEAASAHGSDLRVVFPEYSFKGALSLTLCVIILSFFLHGKNHHLKLSCSFLHLPVYCLFRKKVPVGRNLLLLWPHSSPETRTLPGM